jgi:hypothetical protein
MVSDLALKVFGITVPREVPELTSTRTVTAPAALTGRFPVFQV